MSSNMGAQRWTLPGVSKLPGPVYIFINGYPGVGKSSMDKYLRDSITADEPSGTSRIDTGCQYTILQRRGFVCPHIVLQTLAGDMTVPFVSVILTCELAEHIRRVEERGWLRHPEFERHSSLPDLVEEETRSNELFRFDEYHELVLDTTNLDPRQVAWAILEHAFKIAMAYRLTAPGFQVNYGWHTLSETDRITIFVENQKIKAAADLLD